MSLIDEFATAVEANVIDWSTLVCGRGSLFNRAAFAAARSDSNRDRFLNSLDRAAVRLKAIQDSHQRMGTNHDRSLVPRFAGLAACIRLFLKVGDDQALVREAMHHFGIAGITDSAATDQSDLRLLDGRVSLPYDQAASWALHDVFENLQANQAALREEIAIFVADGNESEVLKLVVERVDGPGIAVPDWWKLGLIAFPKPNEGHSFFAATQRVLGEIAKAKNGRLRWHLEPWLADRNPWNNAFSGRSAEAAAALAGHALFEKRLNASPILNRKMSITATVDGNAAVLNACLGPVNANTLDAKRRAAATTHIDLLVADGRRVKTLADALFQCRLVNELIRRHQDHVASAWLREEPTAERLSELQGTGEKKRHIWVMKETPRGKRN